MGRRSSSRYDGGMSREVRTLGSLEAGVEAEAGVVVVVVTLGMKCTSSTSIPHTVAAPAENRNCFR